MKKTRRIFLWIIGLLLLAFSIYIIVRIDMASTATSAKREATHSSNQIAYAAEALRKTLLARTTTLAPLTDLDQACLQGGNAPIAIEGFIDPGLLVQTVADTVYKDRMRFSVGSFYLKQDQATKSFASLENFAVCGGGWEDNCLYMFRSTNGVFDPSTLHGITAEGMSFNYKDLVTVTGYVIFLEINDFGYVYCRIHVDSLH